MDNIDIMQFSMAKGSSYKEVKSRKIVKTLTVKGHHSIGAHREANYHKNKANQRK